MIKKISFVIFVFIFFFISTSYSQSPIVHKFNYEEIDLCEFQRIILLKKTYWDELGRIQIYFFDNYLKMNQFAFKYLNIPYTKYNDYLNRMVSEGVAKKPIVLPHSVSVIQAVRSERNSLGIIDDGIILSRQNLVKFIEVEKCQ